MSVNFHNTHIQGFLKDIHHFDNTSDLFLCINDHIMLGYFNDHKVVALQLNKTAMDYKCICNYITYILYILYILQVYT